MRPSRFGRLTQVIREATLEQTPEGLVPKDDGWFVLNARDARWFDRGPRGFLCDFQGDTKFDQLGFNLFVLEPGQPMSMYHWEVDQEDFLVVEGEALLIVEDQERPLKKWDLAHCPPHASHTIVGAGEQPCVVLAVGSRTAEDKESWGGYPVNETAARHDASAERETKVPAEAYARFPARTPVAYRDGLLP